MTLDAAGSLAASGPVVPSGDAVVGSGKTQVLRSALEATGVAAVLGDAGSSSGMISSDVARFALAGDRLSAVTVDCRERVGAAVAALSRLAADSATAAGIAKRSPIFSLYGGDRWLAAMMACFDTWFVSEIPPNDCRFEQARRSEKSARRGICAGADILAS